MSNQKNLPKGNKPKSEEEGPTAESDAATSQVYVKTARRHRKHRSKKTRNRKQFTAINDVNLSARNTETNTTAVASIGSTEEPVPHCSKDEPPIHTKKLSKINEPDELISLLKSLHTTKQWTDSPSVPVVKHVLGCLPPHEACSHAVIVPLGCLPSHGKSSYAQILQGNAIKSPNEMIYNDSEKNNDLTITEPTSTTGATMLSNDFHSRTNSSLPTRPEHPPNNGQNDAICLHRTTPYIPPSNYDCGSQQQPERGNDAKCNQQGEAHQSEEFLHCQTLEIGSDARSIHQQNSLQHLLHFEQSQIGLQENTVFQLTPSSNHTSSTQQQSQFQPSQANMSGNYNQQQNDIRGQFQHVEIQPPETSDNTKTPTNQWERISNQHEPYDANYPLPLPQRFKVLEPSVNINVTSGFHMGVLLNYVYGPESSRQHRITATPQCFTPSTEPPSYNALRSICSHYGQLSAPVPLQPCCLQAYQMSCKHCRFCIEFVRNTVAELGNAHSPIEGDFMWHAPVRQQNFAVSTIGRMLEKRLETTPGIYPKPKYNIQCQQWFVDMQNSLTKFLKNEDIIDHQDLHVLFAHGILHSPIGFLKIHQHIAYAIDISNCLHYEQQILSALNRNNCAPMISSNSEDQTVDHNLLSNNAIANMRPKNSQNHIPDYNLLANNGNMNMYCSQQTNMEPVDSQGPTPDTNLERKDLFENNIFLNTYGSQQINKTPDYSHCQIPDNNLSENNVSFNTYSSRRTSGMPDYLQWGASASMRDPQNHNEGSTANMEGQGITYPHYQLLERGQGNNNPRNIGRHNHRPDALKNKAETDTIVNRE